MGQKLTRLWRKLRRWNRPRAGNVVPVTIYRGGLRPNAAETIYIAAPAGRGQQWMKHS